METSTTKHEMMSSIQRNLTTILLGYLAFCLPDIGAAQKLFSVDFESQADLKVYVVDYESRADLLVFRRIIRAVLPETTAGGFSWTIGAKQIRPSFSWISSLGQSQNFLCRLPKSLRLAEQCKEALALLIECLSEERELGQKAEKKPTPSGLFGREFVPPVSFKTVFEKGGLP